MIDNMVIDAIKRANKLGAKGYMVVGVIGPQNAIDDYRIELIVIEPPLQNATELPWYE